MSYKMLMNSNTKVLEICFDGSPDNGEHWEARKKAVEYAETFKIKNLLINLSNCEMNCAKSGMQIFDFFYSWHKEKFPENFRLACVLPLDSQYRKEILQASGISSNRDSIFGKIFFQVKDARDWLSSYEMVTSEMPLY